MIFPFGHKTIISLVPREHGGIRIQAFRHGIQWPISSELTRLNVIYIDNWLSSLYVRWIIQCFGDLSKYRLGSEERFTENNNATVNTGILTVFHSRDRCMNLILTQKSTGNRSTFMLKTELIVAAINNLAYGFCLFDLICWISQEGIPILIVFYLRS